MKSPLNVFEPAPYRWWYFGKRIKWFIRSLKWGWQRATKGYCDCDLWDLDHFYSWLFVNSLRDFKKNLHGAPQRFYDPGADNEIARWEDYIEEMAQHFWNSIEDNVENPYLEDYHNKNPLEIEKDGEFYCIKKNDDARAIEAKDRWMNKEIELCEWRKEEFSKAMEMLEEVFSDLWD